LASTSGTSPSSGNRRADATRRIGQYQLFEEIGRGAGGVVYRALDNMDRDLAIKELPLPQIRRGELGLPRLAPDEIIEARKRFVNEARAVGKLKHPNIVTVHEFIEEPDSLYLVMEFVPGGSLHKLIGGETPPTTGEALGIVCQVAAALGHAHSNGIVHRDIKPGNILVSGRVVKVTDFGIARIISSETMTLTGVVLGTPAWMAPEQISGSEADAKADQFSRGVVAYQLLLQPAGRLARARCERTGRVPQSRQGSSLASAHRSQLKPRKPPARFRYRLLPECRDFWLRGAARRSLRRRHRRRDT
jgi:serine/threonine-protein kinase